MYRKSEWNNKPQQNLIFPFNISFYHRTKLWYWGFLYEPYQVERRFIQDLWRCRGWLDRVDAGSKNQRPGGKHEGHWHFVLFLSHIVLYHYLSYPLPRRNHLHLFLTIHFSLLILDLPSIPSFRRPNCCTKIDIIFLSQHNQTPPLSPLPQFAPVYRSLLLSHPLYPTLFPWTPSYPSPYLCPSPLPFAIALCPRKNPFFIICRNFLGTCTFCAC